MSVHLVIPDSQVKEGVPLDHLDWIGQYIVDKKPDKIIHLGDFADMESLCSYDRGKKSYEGRRYKKDIDVANHGFDRLNAAFNRENARLVANKKAKWLPERYMLLGNHENRINRATDNSAELDGTISTDDLNYAKQGWNVVPFLVPLELDGVWYAHYFYNPLSGNPYGGSIENRLNKIGKSFTQGHTQTFLVGEKYIGNKSIHGLVAGASYLQKEDYLGPQGNDHWRGIIMKHEVEDGMYDIMKVSLRYLCRRYEGVTLQHFMKRKYKIDW